MIKEYLSSLEKCYGYTGNWQPNCPVQVGNWTDVELGFLPWLKRFLGISYANLDINQSIHSIMTETLNGVESKKEKRASLTLSHNVLLNMSGDCSAVSIKAKKRGGFFAVFQDVQEVTADAQSFRNGLDQLNKPSVAVISGVTYVKKGILVVFNQEEASLTLSGEAYSLAGLTDAPSSVKMDFHVSCGCDGTAIFQAEPTKPLVPFFKIYIAEKDKKNGFSGRASRPGRNYDITPFSYQDFFHMHKEFDEQEED
ncbi:MAG: hypothetical protein K2H01_04430 [Ruminococcus sp.]|nr:hypothetical protein [Ruminococcus sp.]